MSLSVELFWSFRSPYSYLVTGRMVQLARSHDVQIVVRPVYPLAVRDPAFFKTGQNPMWLGYTLKDVMRVAQFLQIPIAPPRPDPIVQNMATREVAAEQPYIHRLTRLGLAAAEAGHGLAFIDEVSKIIWSGAVQNWHEGAHLADAAARAGCDLAALDRVAEADADRLDAVAEDNLAALNAAGHWGVPTMVFQGEPFFGQDRFDLLVWRLKQAGVKSREATA